MKIIKITNINIIILLLIITVVSLYYGVQKNENYIALFMPIITSLLTYIGLKMQIKSTSDSLIKKYNIEKILRLLDNVSELLFELKEDETGNFSQGIHVSNKYFICEKKILLSLNIDKTEDKDLYDYLYSLTDNSPNNITKKDAVKAIQDKSQKVINNLI
jgi:hypothetical protein